MKAMILEHTWAPGETLAPLKLATVPTPTPSARQLLVRVSTCAVCHTELDEIEGRTPPPRFPVIPGHQIVGTVMKTGEGTRRLQTGDRVGIAWINSACGTCDFCKNGAENLCAEFMATGRDANGGYAEFVTIHEDFAYVIPPALSDSEAAPLLCAGAIGYRSLRLTGLRDGQPLGLTGFGASAHLVLKLVRHSLPATRVLVFSRSEREREFAGELGAFWAGDFADTPPLQPAAIIDTTPAWRPILHSLQWLAPGGRLVINAIRKEPADREVMREIDYPTQLWLEKEIKSVANVTRRDVSEFLELAGRIPIVPDVEEFPLERANEALMELRERKIRGAKVLRT